VRAKDRTRFRPMQLLAFSLQSLRFVWNCRHCWRLFLPNLLWSGL